MVELFKTWWPSSLACGYSSRGSQLKITARTSICWKLSAKLDSKLNTSSLKLTIVSQPVLPAKRFNSVFPSPSLLEGSVPGSGTYINIIITIICLRTSTSGHGPLWSPVASNESGLLPKTNTWPAFENFPPQRSLVLRAKCPANSHFSDIACIVVVDTFNWLDLGHYISISWVMMKVVLPPLLLKPH